MAKRKEETAGQGAVAALISIGGARMRNEAFSKSPTMS